MNTFQKMKLAALTKKIEKLIRQREAGDNKAATKEINLQLELGKFYDQRSYDKTVPYANLLALEAYRAAGMLGDPNAQFIFADRMLQQANFWQNYANSIHGSNIHHKYADRAYNEAHAHLDQAIMHGHILAKRIKGLCFIRGWGIEMNTEKGANMVIESIKEEGTWDKANKIFEELGLHSPEIFASLMHQVAKKE